MDTKQQICETAVRLFNSEGYSAVSLRQIAAEAGTTIGNLTYHFGKKEDLLETILSDLHTGFSSQFSTAFHGHELLRHLIDLVVANERNQRLYPFYFQNISEILRASESLQRESDAFSHALYTHYASCLRTLQDDGIIRDDLDRKTLDAFAYTIVDMESGWLEPRAPYANSRLPHIAVSQAICRMLKAFVSRDHVEALLSTCAERGVDI